MTSNTTPTPRPNLRDGETLNAYASRIGAYLTDVYGPGRASDETIAEALRVADRDTIGDWYEHASWCWLVDELERRHPGTRAATRTALLDHPDHEAAFAATMLAILGL